MVPQQPATPSNAGGVANANNTRPSTLTSALYPVLSKLLKSHQEEGVVWNTERKEFCAEHYAIIINRYVHTPF